MLIKNPKLTEQDRKYFDEKAKITEAARAGKLGKSWFRRDGDKYELRPKKIYKRV